MLRKIGKYFREISVVIIGIVITFTGSDLIAKRGKQKEVRTVMELIREELKANAKDIEYMAASIQQDSMIFTYLESSLDNIRMLSADTLKENQAALGRVNIFMHGNDAFELLKNSSLMQHVKNKELLLKVMKAYDIILFKEIQIKYYGDYKQKMVVDKFMNVPKQVYERIVGEDKVYEFYEFGLSHEEFWSFIKFIPTFLDNAEFSENLNQVYGVIELLDKEYGFKD